MNKNFTAEVADRIATMPFAEKRQLVIDHAWKLQRYINGRGPYVTDLYSWLQVRVEDMLQREEDASILSRALDMEYA